MRWLSVPVVVLLLAAAAPDHRELRESLSYGAMMELLAGLDSPVAQVETIGTSTEGRAIPAVRLRRPDGEPSWTMLFFGQQHGNEVAGKDALVTMIRQIVAEPGRLPEDVELWIVPLVNPDGAVAGARRTAGGVDLNRDHLTLAAPETLALHRLVQRVRPHLAVDCHEFTRDSGDYRDEGWGEWPIVMMGAANHPFLPAAVRRAGRDWVERAVAPMRERGHRYGRYLVGGVPPGAEQRPSTLDADDARNGLALYGALSFIIESGVRRSAPDPNADLGARVDAVLTLLWRFVEDDGSRHGDRALVEALRRAPAPRYLPTNFFWGNVPADDGADASDSWLGGPAIGRLPVIDLSTDEVRWLDTPHLMTTLVVKRSVPAPRGYAVMPAAADAFAELLGRHAIPFRRLARAEAVTAERCALERVEQEFDEVYQRYGGRQVVACGEAASVDLPAGSLIVELEPPWARRAAAVLEPAMLYGLYQFEPYRALVPDDDSIPVLRVGHGR
jgi:hypothetical protein